jgi:hypothetical protein
MVRGWCWKVHIRFKHRSKPSIGRNQREHSFHRRLFFARPHNTRKVMHTLNMVPETEPALFVAGAGHIVHVPDPSLPNGAGLGSIYGTLPLKGVRRIGDFPFAGPAGCTRIVFPV